MLPTLVILAQVLWYLVGFFKAQILQECVKISAFVKHDHQIKFLHFVVVEKGLKTMNQLHLKD